VNARPIIWLSLGLNVVLFVAVGYFALRQPVLRTVPREVRLAPANNSMPANVSNTNAAVSLSGPGVEEFSWAQLASTDFKAYRDRLRAIGCPAETVRDIIIAEINEKYRLPRAELVAEVQRRYWELTAKGKDALKNWESSLEKLDEERQALIEEVLGQDPDEGRTNNERQTHSLENSYAWLPAEKQARLVELELEFQKRNQALWETIRQRTNSEATAEENQKFKALQNELTTARQQALSPEEYREYRLRNSPAGNWSRNLAGFETTETEWRAVAQLKLEYQEALEKAFPQPPELDYAFARRYGLSATTGSAEASAQAEVRRQLQAELDAATKTALGPGRWAEYELAQSADYQQTRRITERYQLPASLAQQAYELQRTAAAHAQATRTDADLSAEARASALAAIRQETERALAATLGSKVFNTYQEYHGNWLQQLDQVPEENP